MQVLQFLMDARDPTRLAHRAAASLGLLPEVLWAELDGPLSGDPGRLTAELDEPGGQAPRRLTIQLVDPDDGDARSTLEGLMSLISVVYRRERELKRLGDAAQTDALTGLWNRRGFDELLDQALARAGRTGEDIALMLCDIDQFKGVNDTLGHEAGDRVLVAVAQAMRSVIRPTDVAARIGGDEIAIILSGSNAMGALRVAERLRDALTQSNPIAPRPLTISVGIADTRALNRVAAGEDSREQLCRAADETMYEAKRAGRNRAMCHGSAFAPVETLEEDDTAPIELPHAS